MGGNTDRLPPQQLPARKSSPARLGWALYALPVSLLSPHGDLGQILSPPGTRDSREGKKGHALMVLSPTAATQLSSACGWGRY